MAMIGQTLASAREAAGCSVQQLSETTRISGALIRAMERDDFAACGGDFYARGHIRAVCKVLGIDPVPLVARFDADHADAPAQPRSAEEVFAARSPEPRPRFRPKPKPKPAPKQPPPPPPAAPEPAPAPAPERRAAPEARPAVAARPGPGRPRWRLLGAVAAAVLLLAVVTLTWSGWAPKVQSASQLAVQAVSGPPVPNEQQPPADPDPDPGPLADDSQAERTQVDQAERERRQRAELERADRERAEREAAAAQDAQVAHTQAEQRIEEEEEEETEEEGADGTVMLNLEASERIWVSVHNGAGDNLFTGVLAEGESRDWSAEDELRLHLGDGESVRLRVNGEDIGSPGVSGQVTRLTFGPADPQ